MSRHNSYQTLNERHITSNARERRRALRTNVQLASTIISPNTRNATHRSSPQFGSITVSNQIRLNQILQSPLHQENTMSNNSHSNNDHTHTSLPLLHISNSQRRNLIYSASPIRLLSLPNSYIGTNPRDRNPLPLLHLSENYLQRNSANSLPLFLLNIPHTYTPNTNISQANETRNSNSDSSDQSSSAFRTHKIFDNDHGNLGKIKTKPIAVVHPMPRNQQN